MLKLSFSSTAKGMIGRRRTACLPIRKEQQLPCQRHAYKSVEEHRMRDRWWTLPLAHARGSEGEDQTRCLREPTPSPRSRD
jgi:hypothetical protein